MTDSEKGNTPYQPINCSFYDRLEHYATLRQMIPVEFKVEPDRSLRIIGRIKDLQNMGDGEYLILESYPDPIRLDRLISVDGHFLPGQDFC